MKFDMNTCWSRGVDLVQSNFSLLVVIAGVFVFLPTVAIYLLIPDLQMLADPGTDPAVLEDRMGDILAPILAGAFISSLFQFVGQAAMVALMGDSRPTVGQAIASGIKALPSLIVVMLVFFTILFIGGIIVMLPITLLAGATGAPALSVLALVPLMIFAGWLMARLSMTMPAMVLGNTLNPFKAMGESYGLTKKSPWAILLFWAIIYAVITIISLLLNGVVGVAAAMLGSGTTAMLIAGLSNGFTGAITGMIICALAVAMYAQLSGPSTETIEETFD